MRKKKIWIAIPLCLLLLGGGFLLTPTGQNHLSLGRSPCRFNPTMDPQIESLIRETILTVANGSLFSLMGKKRHLNEMGDTISAAITDFAYWGYIFSTPELAQGMKKIKGSSPKYEGFLKGTQNKLVRECNDNPCFWKQAEGFAAYLHLPQQELLPLLQEGIENSTRSKYAFRPYLDYLIAHTTSQ